MKKKEAIIQCTEKELEDFFERINELSRKLMGIEIFDRWVTTVGLDPERPQFVDMTVVFRKQGFEERGETPLNLGIYTSYKRAKENRESAAPKIKTP